MESTETLVPKVYEALRQRAAHLLGRGGGSLSPQSLVHDVLVKLYRAETQSWRDERHFRAVAAIAMRQLLVDRARRKATARHGASPDLVSLTNVAVEGSPLDVVALTTALDQLEAARPRAAEVLMLRLFGGLSHEEIAEETGCSLSTVKREWRLGQAWLQKQLT
ncbi:MAG: sigma-70 family RNA polymerase sigma factor [Myxococcales bacterium]|nr:sigma-70 family RNA polymerase sigma factor [Myxococcales bacterium]MCB9671128.1 sigma-70 family RNA polymerase sigma factor [Alphaproteobacteria bacterium]MCB9691694.1 sigma-70 family RNA polymerase sigma factor [Alphaproteobacteria bacterium]